MRPNPVGSARSPGRRWGRWAAFGLVLSAAACYPGDGPQNVQDVDVVLTMYDEDVNFASFQTWAMPDTVLHLSSDTLENIIELPRVHDDLILDLVASNMAAAGYTRELDPQTNGADLIMLVGAIGVERTEYWVYYDWWYYWGYYPGWGYPGYPSYGPGYGYYYPPAYVGSTTFEQGSVVLTLVDPSQGDGERIPVVWTGAVAGLLSESSVPESRITSTINQAFTQSPYLGR